MSTLTVYSMLHLCSIIHNILFIPNSKLVIADECKSGKFILFLTEKKTAFYDSKIGLSDISHAICKRISSVKPVP